jgi:XRE family transcriptional regulator, regulator of sulfur utilization
MVAGWDGGGNVALEQTAENLARNLRALRDARGLSQQQVARLAGVPRATWAHLESGSGNPTLAVLLRVAATLHTTVEELLGPPRGEVRLVKRADLTSRTRGGVRIEQVLPDALPGLVIERMDFPPDSVLVGVPHTPGTREYLTCETGALELVGAGAVWALETGDVVVFRGDQKHTYRNRSHRPAVAYSVVVLAPGAM